jgi:hypothetical protein
MFSKYLNSLGVPVFSKYVKIHISPIMQKELRIKNSTMPVELKGTDISKIEMSY